MKTFIKRSGLGLGAMALLYFAFSMMFAVVEQRISEKDRIANRQGLDSGYSNSDRAKPRAVNMRSAWAMESGQML